MPLLDEKESSDSCYITLAGLSQMGFIVVADTSKLFRNDNAWENIDGVGHKAAKSENAHFTE